AGAARPGAGARPGSATPRRTSTTTGLRWGGVVSRPLVALVLVVLFAVLGALFADRVWGAERTPTTTSSGAASLADVPGRGMLPLRTLEGGSAQAARGETPAPAAATDDTLGAAAVTIGATGQAPSLDRDAGQTTTARNL
ncbi:hypothetical protein ICW40_20480, partial [Actinotalea ferrariae]|nr:hypothetical protein [Actinotalea ferrariae]